MIDSLPPASIILLGALLVPLLRGKVLQVYLLALPVTSLLLMLRLFELDAGSGRASHLSTLTLLQLDVVHSGTERHLAQRQRIANPNVGARS